MSVPVLTYVHFLPLFHLWLGLWRYDTWKYYVHVGNASVNPVYLWNVLIKTRLAAVIPKSKSLSSYDVLLNMKGEKESIVLYP